MASDVRVSENEMTTALAFARPTSSSTCSSAESPYTTGWPICRAARTRAASRSIAMYSKPCASSTRATFWPTRPKPHRITCSRLATASVTASSRSIAVFGGPRSPSNRRATRLLLARMTGASTMPSTTATSSGCAMAGSMALFCSSSVSSAMPNSPPTASVTPVRSALKLESTNTRVANAAMTRLDHHHRDQQREDEPELAPQRVEVEQHADGDEEQAQQDVAERPDDAFDLVAVFGFGQHHSREECAQRHRQARHVAKPTPTPARPAARRA